VFIASSDVKPGDKIRVRVVDADEYDLWAEQI
jgi:ribosomal protein S12 methylthiotransferase